ncbi:hypothetical protein E6P09_03170 [Haloferax mediterranei ATCC 33500]|uniref:Uncharacterized protein n=1 Tax=Haloferax mediterranei (strain ATCC 33500 / DSM 1411 / JCM 8866 / NBRC 14739 / NCIMB 2177 / R-4) TaxID=523841 RepID=I3R0J9_HALMT|nr:hypothetical protein [Haloferax mediterranei]AFK17759.1 hypothetical protein HFX_0015 [Haloferax mediterranei ATCC 33500]AHZ22809.1 hypothetical protein BM92_09210 [Haloferax mediterranei ATCC 33500]EMA02969.1 hypothetical protein C439_10310 [Haloferax mediterranei ATCC 33500]MDX5987848.1 hypothetical protein [Haloferax mediterranei ATCC 33500]QCQ74324.1 hypothetical protein E6P09_03170 [Haloferax mediterranei ATCC 33500]
MFETRTLPSDLESIRDEYAPSALVLNVSGDFDTIPPEAAENLGLVVDSLSPAAYPAEWLPDDVPKALRRYASSDFTVGMPGDGTVTWTWQTTPPVVLVKYRAKGTPDDFLDFLIAEALVQAGTDDIPEHFLPFFGEQYRDLEAAMPLGPSETYQVAAALYEGWVGLQTREEFASWDGRYDRLHDAWVDAGERLDDRLANLPRLVALGRLSFPEATEFACSAIKHERDLPAPFAALDTAAYLDHGPTYAVKWAEKTFEQLAEGQDARDTDE